MKRKIPLTPPTQQPQQNATTMCIAMAPSKVEYSIPSAYRLFKRKDGTLILQGAYQWHEGCRSGHEWRDIPTVEES